MLFLVKRPFFSVAYDGAHAVPCCCAMLCLMLLLCCDVAVSTWPPMQVLHRASFRL